MTGRNSKAVTSAFWISLLVLLAVVALAGYSVKSLYAAMQWVVHTQNVLTRIDRLHFYVKDAESSARGFGLSAWDPFIQPFEASVAGAWNVFEEVGVLTADNERQQKRLAALQTLLTRKIAHMQRTMELRRAEGIAAVQAHVAQGEGRALMQQISAGIRDLVEEENELMQLRLRQTRGQAVVLLAFMGGGALLNFLLTGGVFFILRRDLAERERSQQLLKASADEVNDLYDRAPCAYFSADSQGVISRANATMLRWFGYDRAEVEGRLSLRDLRAPEERGSFHEEFEALKQTPGETNTEAEYVRKDGSRLPVLLNADVQRNARGEFVSARVTVFDITERKRAETVVRQARAYAENIVNTVRSPLVVLTEDLRVRSANRAFYEMFKATSANIEGRLFSEINQGQWAIPELLRALEDVVPKQLTIENFEVSVGVPGLGKRVFEINARKMYQPGNHTTMTLVAFEDVTDVRRGEALHRQFRALFESLPGRYLVLNPNLGIVAVSDAYLEATMTTREKIVDRPLFEVFPDNPDDPHADGVSNLRASLNKVIQTGAPDSMPIQRYDIQRADGTFEERYWSPVNSPILGTDSSLEYIIHRVEDVTDFVKQKNEGAGSIDKDRMRERLAEMEAEVFGRVRELGVANQQLRALNEELEAFSYSVSHDLRAPLRHIAGFSDMLVAHAGDKLDEKGRRYLATITEAASRMGNLIDDLLAFSRASRTEMRRQAVSLDDLVETVRLNLQGEVAGRKIAWKIDPLPEVDGDAPALRQVIANLLSNAVKYTRGRELARIEVGAKEEEGETIVFIRDNGAGFDMKYAGKLFGVFQRLHTSREFEGTGVGLAIVRRVIQRHGGRVWVDARVGEGATFYFTLPLSKPAKTQATETLA
jgi:PAS domain S-box-containing protein